MYGFLYCIVLYCCVLVYSGGHREQEEESWSIEYVVVVLRGVQSNYVMTVFGPGGNKGEE